MRPKKSKVASAVCHEHTNRNGGVVLYER